MYDTPNVPPGSHLDAPDGRPSEIPILSRRASWRSHAHRIGCCVASTVAILFFLVRSPQQAASQTPPTPTSPRAPDPSALLFHLPTCELAGTIRGSDSIVRAGEPLTITIRAVARCPQLYDDQRVILVVGGIEPEMWEDARASLGHIVHAFRSARNSEIIFIDVTRSDQPPHRADTPAEFDALSRHVAAFGPGPTASAADWIRAVETADGVRVGTRPSQRPLLLILDRAGVEDDAAPLRGPLHSLVTNVRDAAGRTVVIEASFWNPLFPLLLDMAREVSMVRSPDPFQPTVYTLLAALGEPMNTFDVATFDAQTIGDANNNVLSVDVDPPATFGRGLTQEWKWIDGGFTQDVRLRLVYRFRQEQSATRLVVVLNLSRYARLLPTVSHTVPETLLFCVAAQGAPELTCPAPSPTPTATPPATPMPVPPDWNSVYMPRLLLFPFR